MERNDLYPVFLKVHKLNLLIIGGGNVGLEKLTFLLKSSPNANIVMLAKDFLPTVKELAMIHNVMLIQKPYHRKYLKKKHMVIAATDDLKINQKIYADARKRYLLANIADTPELCDYYMGGIVTKGNVKVAISTNGKSPTTAKRLRQFFEQVIPEDINKLVQNLNEFRKTIKGDFEEKVETLNEVTKGLIAKNS